MKNNVTRLKFIPIVAALLCSCQSMQSSDPSSVEFNIPGGSTLSLNKSLEIPGSETHVRLQAGKQIADRDKDDYRLNCRFDLKQFGPRSIQPETFKILRTEDGQEWVSRAGIMRYYTEVYLQSEKGTDVIKLSCQQSSDMYQRHFTVADMQNVLGEYFTFTFPK
jgi:hypothetical protein